MGERGATFETEKGIEGACVQINGGVHERVKWRAGSSGVFSLAETIGGAATNRKV